MIKVEDVKMDPYIECRVAGRARELLYVDPRVWQCGHIRDGIVMEAETGGWLMSFHDLEKIYKTAIEHRLGTNAHMTFERDKK